MCVSTLHGVRNIKSGMAVLYNKVRENKIEEKRRKKQEQQLCQYPRWQLAQSGVWMRNYAKLSENREIIRWDT